MSQSTDKPNKPEKPRKTPFFIDGEKYTTTDHELTVAAVLAFVGKPAGEWYLVEKHGREQTEFRDGQTVPIKPGAKFLTVFVGPTPVS